MGRIHSIETFGAVDGPGIRFVVFFQGCPMRCQYCHNPDSWEYGGGTEKSVEELVTEIKKYKHYFGETGGVTVSGGEPLAQIDFLTELFEALKGEGIHTCLDTSGVTFNTTMQTLKKFDKLMEFTDLVLLDIKHIDRDKHKSLTGHYNDSVLEFARYLDKKSIPVWIRHVLVPGVTADKKQLTKLREFLDTLTNVEKIEVLPYHTLGVSKYEKLGLDYSLKGVDAPTSEEIEIANTILQKERNK